MKTRTKTTEEKQVRKVSINVCANDRQDIKCGGPSFLGFDFHIDADEAPAKLRKFLEKELTKRKLPAGSIQIDAPEWVESEAKCWSREEISTCIKGEADYLRGEANRSY